MEAGQFVEFGLSGLGVVADAQHVFGDLVVSGAEGEAEHELTVSLSTPVIPRALVARLPG